MTKHNIAVLLAVVALTLGAASCKNDDDGKVLSIGLKEAAYKSTPKPHMELTIPSLSATLQLTPFIMPINADNQTVEYTNARPDLLDVSPSGLLTPKAAGTDTLTVKATDGSGVYTRFWVVIKE